MTRDARFVAALATIAVAVAGCGSSSSSTGGKTTTSAATTTTTTTSSTATTSNPPPAVAELPAAEHPTASEFPASGGKTLQQLAATVKHPASLGAATGTFTPGTRRFAFGLSTANGAFIYAPTALYLAKSPKSKAIGPFLAPDDPMTVATQYRSQQNSGPGGIEAIYEATLPLTHPGTYTVLALTRTSVGLVGSPGEIAVAASSPIPDVGQKPPAITTLTKGPTSILTTRTPPEQMHSVSFASVLGKQPIALLFSTPELCTSRVCGPVTDIVVSLQHEFASRMAFIHQEVYVDNTPSKGLRPQMHEFHLETEPWLFVINREGVITARLEGAFGIATARKALESGLS